jgi:DNA modification methylase
VTSCDDRPVTLLTGDAREVLASMRAESAACVVTSPPYYGLRDYQSRGQYGLETTPGSYVETLRLVFREVRRVLDSNGTLWLNLGDCYSSGTRGSYDTVGGKTGGRGLAVSRPVCGIPGKNLLGIPWRVAFALQADGWTIRNAIVWHKPNAMPESVRDRLSCRYELIFLLAKHPGHWFDADAIRRLLHDGPPTHLLGPRRKPGSCDRWRRTGAGRSGSYLGDLWRVPTRPFRAAHFAVFPIDIPLRCIAAGCPPGGTVLDPFSGAGTTGLAARRLGRRYVGIDINPAYHRLAEARMADEKHIAVIGGGQP